MQKADNEKTGSGRNGRGGLGRAAGRNVLFTGVVLACLAGLAILLLGRLQSASREADTAANQGAATDDGDQKDDLSPASFTYTTVPMVAGNRTFTLDIADTADKQRLGLGDRDALDPDEGMVFTYPSEGERCFWMKDMRFSIDIVWLDAHKGVVHVESSLSPDTYPQTYCPEKGAQYVVELAAGAAKAAGLKTGSTVGLEL